jgi:hypothetical protein
MKNKIKLGIFIFLIGLAGVLSTLAMEIPLPKEIQKAISKIFTPWEFKLLSLINPTIMLFFAAITGTLLYDKVHFQIPLIERLILKAKNTQVTGLLKFGVIGGLISGILITLTTLVFNPVLPAEFIELGNNFKPPLITRFLYGGLTEEILIRFGVMTFVVWLLVQISGKLNPLIYWIGILISAIVFGVGHLPIVFTMVKTPTVALVIYIIFGNAVGGIVFGWLYWKKGLETAMIAHVFAHIIMLVAALFLTV